MNKNENTNKYANAANVANKFMDAMFTALNLDNVEKYHITEDDLKAVVDGAKEKTVTAKDSVKEFSNKLMVDFSDLAKTIDTVFSEYKAKYCTPDTEVTEDEVEDDTCGNCDCINCADCPYDVCDEDCDDECCNAYTHWEDDDLPDYDAEYCHSITDRLKQEFNTVRQMDAEDDEVQPQDIFYPYECVLNDINCVLDDVENEDYELIPANDQCKHDTVHVTYHLGYDTENDVDMAMSYANRLADDLRELYGFSEVHINVETFDEYLTYNIYMMI